MKNVILATLAREWIGVVLGGLLIAPGTVALVSGPEQQGNLMTWVLFGSGILVILGAARHLARLAWVKARYPAPGQRIDVGGYKMHVLAEGASGSNLPVVWLGGGHAAGAVMDHLHRALSTETRSILVDRPGTGWSDTGPFPRTTVREVDEVLRALDGAGERGPFVLVGYSFGGLLAANIARRAPGQVAKLILLDATPLETIVFGPRLGALRDMRADALKTALLRLLGLQIDLADRRARRNPHYAAGKRTFEAVLGSALGTLKAIELSAGSQLASYSIYRELSPDGIAACGWETVVYDGDLGDMPVLVVAPATAEEVGSQPEIAEAVTAERIRMERFYAATRERYMAISSNARRVCAPPGTTHQFVYEAPDFVIEVVRQEVATP